MRLILRKGQIGFTLLEMLIVLIVIGILAAIVIPSLQEYGQKAKEAAAKENLSKLRNIIELYATQHNDYAPGYVKEVISTAETVVIQLCSATNLDGEDAPVGTEGFPLGSYLTEMPDNPFNNDNSITIIADEEAIPEKADGASGWIYKPATKTIKLNYPGTDSEGNEYYGY